MIITIRTNDKELSVNTMAETKTETAGYPEVIATLMGAMESYCTTFMEGLNAQEIDGLHDYMSTIFSLFIEKNFPGNSDFGLSDAAVVYAQDQIIMQAAEKGIPVAEAINMYNKQAEDYFVEKKNAGKMS